MKAMLKYLTVISLVLFAFCSVYAGEKDPVAFLSQVKGKVEYTKDGTKWKQVNGSKFLFIGYKVRTGADASGQVVMQKTGQKLTLAPNSVVSVIVVEKDNEGRAITKEYRLETENGSLTAVKDSNKLVASLMKRFTQAQVYTTIRRAAKTNEIVVKAPRNSVVTDEYPHFAWNNLGKQYNYRLRVGDRVYDIAETEGNTVRVALKPFKGTQVLEIHVLKGQEEVASLEKYGPKKKYHTISWLSNKKKIKFEKTKKSFADEYGEDSFMLGTYFEEQKMWVAAMDHYESYLKKNPDEIEMTPYLFKVYQTLKLTNAYDEKLKVWNEAMKK